MEGKEKIILRNERLIHLLNHFNTVDESFRSQLFNLGFDESNIVKGLLMPGSKFHSDLVQNPDHILRLIDRGRGNFKIEQGNGNRAYTLEFDENIGTEGIVAFEELNDVQRKGVKEIVRNGFHLKAIESPIMNDSKQLTYILNTRNELITAFPGRYAPPLPHSEMTFDEKRSSLHFWLNHAFILIS